MRIASLAARLVTQADVQQFVREYEFRLLETECGSRVDEELFLICRNRGDGDAEAVTDRWIFDDRERGGKRAEKRIAVDEPTARTLRDRKIFVRVAKPEIVSGGNANGARYRRFEPSRERTSPVIGRFRRRRVLHPEHVTRRFARGSNAANFIRTSVVAKPSE